MAMDSKLSRREVLDMLTLLLLVRRPAWNFYLWLMKFTTVNQRFTLTPAAVTYPNTADDVSAVLKIAQSYNYKATARSGGVRTHLRAYLMRSSFQYPA